MTIKRTRSRSALSQALTLSLMLAATPAAFASQDIDKVNGSITVDASQPYGDLDTVNGSINIGDGARVEDAETVNGSIKVGANVQAQSLSTVNGGIRIGNNARIADDVGTVNGGIFVDRGSRIGGDVSTVNGAIGLVDTDLAGDIETVNGDITVGIGSHVRGGIRYQKPNASWFSLKKRNPRVIIGPDARVDGPLVFERKVELYVHSSARTGTVTGATAVRYDGARAPVE